MRRVRKLGSHFGEGVLALMVAALLVGLMAFASPASAATSVNTYNGPQITKISQGALRLSYAGNSYICYSGDACMFRGGKFAAYYKCQTITNTATSSGWFVNNQVGSGGTVRLYLKPGYTFSNGKSYGDFAHSQNYSVGLNWNYIASFRTCT